MWLTGIVRQCGEVVWQAGRQPAGLVTVVCERLRQASGGGSGRQASVTGRREAGDDRGCGRQA